MTQTKQTYSLDGVVTKIDRAENRVAFSIKKADRQYAESPPVSFMGEQVGHRPDIREGAMVRARFTLSDRTTSPRDGSQGKPYKDGVSIALLEKFGPNELDAPTDDTATTPYEPQSTSAPQERRSAPSSGGAGPEMGGARHDAAAVIAAWVEKFDGLPAIEDYEAIADAINGIAAKMVERGR